MTTEPMPETTLCPLCAGARTDAFSRDERRTYLKCEDCGLVFVPPALFLSEEDEKRRYDLHQNSCENAGYCAHLNRLLVPLLSCLPPGSKGLDFGSGPTPALSLMLAEAGHTVTLYDRYYAHDPTAFDQRYDFITASEVTEHLREPGKELDRLWAGLEDSGTLAIMTQFLVNQSEFPRWYYKNDPTHVCFFSPPTFAWLAKQWNAELIIPERGVVLLRKRDGKIVHPLYPGIAAPAGTLTVLYQDEHLVAITKPAGLLAHRSDIDRFSAENAMNLLRDQLKRWVYPLHRLDKPTSGVMLFALDPATARSMTQLFTDNKVRKQYLAVVRGHTDEAGSIDHPLHAVQDKRANRKAKHDLPAQEATTEYQRLAMIELPLPAGRYQTARFSLVRVSPLTGRYRQIRRHMKHIFHPVIGDTTYGDGKQNAFFLEHFNSRRLLLHAHELGFVHPHTNTQVLIRSPLDPDFAGLLNALHWSESVLS